MSGKVLIALILLTLTGLGGWMVWQRLPGAQSVRFLDIGQGDATLVTGTGNTQLLVDAGPDESVMTQLGRSLPPFDRTIELAVISHPHTDHYRGYHSLLKRYQVRRLYVSAADPGNAEYRDVLAEARRRGTQVAVPAPGESFSYGGLSVRFLHTGADSVTPRNLNNASIVLTVTIGTHTILFPGDAEAEEERQLVRAGLPAVTILKVPHHGSKTSSTREFLEVVRPRTAVISTGTQNRYGHPNPDTISRLRQQGATVYRTDLSGSITVRGEGAGATVETER